MALLEELLQKKASINWLPQQEGDVPETFANIDKAKNLFNYYPSTSLRDSISKYINWLNDGLKN